METGFTAELGFPPVAIHLLSPPEHLNKQTPFHSVLGCSVDKRFGAWEPDVFGEESREREEPWHM
jgi:hypothetical protein